MGKTTQKDKATEPLKPKTVTSVHIPDEVEIQVPVGYLYISPTDESGNEYDEAFLTTERTWNKVYSRQQWGNGKSKFTIKKKTLKRVNYETFKKQITRLNSKTVGGCRTCGR